MPENRFYENLRIVRSGANMNRAGVRFFEEFHKKGTVYRIGFFDETVPEIMEIYGHWRR